MEIILAFLGGLLNFIAPCFFLILLGYLAAIAGISIRLSSADYSKGIERTSLKVFLTASHIFLGLSLIFIVIAFPGPIQRFIVYYHGIFAKTAGVIVIFFGVTYLQLMERERFLNLPGFFLLGIAFGIAWTHCLTPILSLILSPLARTSDVPVLKGVLFLVVYSLGLGVPIIISGLLLSWFLRTFKSLTPYYGLIRFLSGGFLTFMGIALVFTPLWIYLSRIFIGLTSNSLSNRLELMVIEFFR